MSHCATKVVGAKDLHQKFHKERLFRLKQKLDISFLLLLYSQSLWSGLLDHIVLYTVVLFTRIALHVFPITHSLLLVFVAISLTESTPHPVLEKKKNLNFLF